MLVEIYTKDNCPACNQTKKLLAERNLGYQEYKIGRDISREQVMERFPDAQSVPIVVVDGRRIQDITQYKFLTEA